ncbi:MAG: ATP-binding protein [Pseudomonadota bacterium]
MDHLTTTIGDIAEPVHTVTKNLQIADLMELFKKNGPITAVVVTDAARIAGIVMNIHLDRLLSQRYGFSVFSQRPVSNVMDPSPLIVDYSEAVGAVASMAMTRQADKIYDHIVVTRHGRLAGIVPVRKILDTLVAFHKKYTAMLEHDNRALEREIKEKKSAIDSLKASRQMLQLVIDAIPHAIFWKDRKSRYLGSNKKFAGDAGFADPQDVIGLDDLMLPWAGQQASSFMESDNQVMENDKSLLHIREYQTLAHGQQRILDKNKLPLHGMDGRVVGVLCFYEDITDRVNADKARKDLEKSLARAQKMEVIGQLAGGVAHDLNNILSGIVGYPELILMDLPEGSALKKPIQTIKNSGERAAAIVQDLLTLARRGVTSDASVDVKTMVREYLESPEAKKLEADHPHVTIINASGRDPLFIRGSSVHLMKTLMNLVNNAMEAMEGTGRIIISAKKQYLDKPIQGYDSVSTGNYVQLSVLDTGKGMCQNDLDRIFEPFYTNKKMGRSGTGLGMSVVWGTVKDHKGYIDIQSELGKGTCVTLYFPLIKIRQSAMVAPALVQNPMGKGETIVVVDDILEQRDMAATYLKRMGYRVMTMGSGEDAVNYLSTRSADLLILDMIMAPGMDGLETFKRILELHPTQKAIIASGFSETDRVREALRLGAGFYLKKPYLLQDLGRTVKEELEKSGKTRRLHLTG